MTTLVNSCKRCVSKTRADDFCFTPEIHCKTRSSVALLVCGWGERSLVHTVCLRIFSFPRISGNLEIPVKSAPLH